MADRDRCPALVGLARSRDARDDRDRGHGRRPHPAGPRAPHRPGEELRDLGRAAPGRLHDRPRDARRRDRRRRDERRDRDGGGRGRGPDPPREGPRRRRLRERRHGRRGDHVGGRPGRPCREPEHGGRDGRPLPDRHDGRRRLRAFEGRGGRRLVRQPRIRRHLPRTDPRGPRRGRRRREPHDLGQVQPWPAALPRRAGRGHQVDPSHRDGELRPAHGHLHGRPDGLGRRGDPRDGRPGPRRGGDPEGAHVHGARPGLRRLRLDIRRRPGGRRQGAPGGRSAGLGRRRDPGRARAGRRRVRCVRDPLLQRGRARGRHRRGRELHRCGRAPAGDRSPDGRPPRLHLGRP